MSDKIQVTFYSKKIKPPFEESYFESIENQYVKSLDELKEYVITLCNNILENNAILEDREHDKDLSCEVYAVLTDEHGYYIAEHFYMFFAAGNIINNKFYWQITYSEPFS